MKKFLTMVCVVGIFAFVHQQSQAQDMNFGLKGGITYHNLKYELGGFDETFDSRLGFTVGVFAEIPFSDMFSFQPELVFAQKGAKDEMDVDFSVDGTVEFEMVLNYIDVPLLARFNVPIDGNINPYVVAGPSVGLLLSANVKEDGESEDISDELNSINFSLVFGAGVNFGNFMVDIRYDLGLANIADFEEDPDDFFDTSDFKITTSGLMFTVGYRF